MSKPIKNCFSAKAPLRKSSLRLKSKYSFIVVFAAGILLKILADTMACYDAFSLTGASLAIIGSVALFIGSFQSFVLSLLVTAITIANGILYFRIVDKLLVHSDVFGTDPWLVIGAWIWILGGILSLLTRLILTAKTKWLRQL